ncbi:MAG: YegP family protein [Candidatus Enteromonas sp.]
MQKKKLILTYALLALTVVISVILGVVGHEKDSMTLFVKALSFSVSEGKTVTVACAGIYGGLIGALVVLIVGLAKKSAKFTANALTTLGAVVAGLGMIDWRLSRIAADGKAATILTLTFVVLALAFVGFLCGVIFPCQKVKEEVAAAEDAAPAEETVPTEETEPEIAEEEKAEKPAEEKPEEAKEEPVEEEKAEEPETPAEEPETPTEEPETPAEEPVAEKEPEVTEEVQDEADAPVEEEKPEEAKEEPVEEEKAEEPKPEPVVETPTESEAKNKVVGKYEVYPAAGFFKYRLKANNGQILLVSRPYKTREGAINGIETFRKNAANGSHRIITDKKGRAQFRIFTANDARLIVAGEIYPNAEGAQKALDSTLRFYDTDNIQNLEEIPESEIREWRAELKDVEAKPNGKIEMFKDDDGKWVGDLRASNSELLFLTTAYSTKTALQNALRSVANNAMKGNISIVCDKQNRYQFKVYSDNGMDLVFGETYDSKEAATSAANSARNFLHGQPKLVDLTKAPAEGK